MIGRRPIVIPMLTHICAKTSPPIPQATSFAKPSRATIAVASALGAWMAWARGMWVFPLVVAWAIYGIGARYADLPAIAEATRIILVVGLPIGTVAWLARLRRARTG